MIPDQGGKEADALTRQIQESLRKATEQKDRLKRATTTYGIANLVLGGMATFIGGIPTVSGTPFFGEWQTTAGVAAVFALLATLAAGLQRMLVSPDTLVKATDCVGKLRALAFDVSIPQFDVASARKQYQDILANYPDLDL
jgi:hypothetical protein